MSIIKGFKGFKKGLICEAEGNKKQYAEGQTFKEEGHPELCKKGLHFCEMPLDVWNYYPPAPGTEYAEVEATGDTVKDGDKSATNELTIKTKISVFQLFKAHFDLVFKGAEKSENKTQTSGNWAHSQTSGDEAHSQTSGNWAIACAIGIQSKARAEKGWIVITDWRRDEDYDWNIHGIHSAQVGKKIKGVKIEADKWYWFEGGELKSEGGEQ